MKTTWLMNPPTPLPSPADASVHVGYSTLGATMAVRWLERELPDPNDQREYAQERCIVAITEAIGEAMERAGVNRTQLAERLGVTKGHVSNLLSGAHNMTLRSLGDLLWACDLEVVDLKLAPLGVVYVPMEEPCAPDESPSPVTANNNLALAA